jgi:hypothetical protein
MKTKRKVLSLVAETEAQVRRLEEIKKLLEIAKQEEQDKLENATTQVQQICDENDIFCGVILTTDDLLGIIRLMIDSKENIKIPFRIYLKEEE